MSTEKTADMPDLKDCRRRIDAIDDQIVRLFEERMKISEQVAAYKIREGMKVRDPKREQEIIADRSAKAHGELNVLGTAEIFRQIMAISRKRQYQLMSEQGIREENAFPFVEQLPVENRTVVFQGVEGAYSHAAMRGFFPPDIRSFHVKTWRDAMEEVVQRRADYAVLPIENSTAGIVEDIYDLLMEYPLYIVGEQIIRVEHVLLGLPGTRLSDLKKIVSHPQGLAQCKKYLEAHPGWKKEEALNTAGAARKVKENGDPTAAAIASREAGEVYDLEVLADHICENTNNSTRFIIVSRKPVYRKDADQVSICFELPHESGSLYNILSHIIYNGLNMTKIESRPVPGKAWEYRFFVDFEGNLNDSSVSNALTGLEAEALKLRILGNY